MRLEGLGASAIKIDKVSIDIITADAASTTIVEMLVALVKSSS